MSLIAAKVASLRPDRLFTLRDAWFQLRQGHNVTFRVERAVRLGNGVAVRVQLRMSR